MWSERWEKSKLTSIQLVTRSVVDALCSNAEDIGELAGENVMTLAHDRGIEVAQSVNSYQSACNHASIADIVATAVHESGPWLAQNGSLFSPDGNYVRRFLPVTSWNEDRALHEIRGWHGIGEVCRLGLPMQLVVAVLGQNVHGRRRGYWSRGLLHPANKAIRFQRRHSRADGFKETWIEVFREDHAQISRDKWLTAMKDDMVLQETLFVVNIPVPSNRDAILEFGKRKLDAIQQLTVLPDKQLSTCFDSINPCPFRECCHGTPELGPEAGGFIETP